MDLILTSLGLLDFEDLGSNWYLLYSLCNSKQCQPASPAESHQGGTRLIGGLVIGANHQSAFDFFGLVLFLLWLCDRECESGWVSLGLLARAA